MRNFVSALAAAGALVVMPLAAQAHSVQYGTAANWSLFRNSEGGQAYTGMAGMWTSESCNIGYGGQEQRIAPYQVLMGQGNWQAFTGAVPGNAVEGGFEANGAKLYICRGTYNNLLLAGKFRPGFSGCNVGDSGQEIAVFPFDLLTF